MTSDSPNKIAEEEFQDTLLAQIQIIDNIQSQSKSIINFTLAILAVTASIISTTGIPSLSPDLSAATIEKTAESSLLSATALTNLVISSYFTMFIVILFIITGIFYSYGYIFRAFRTPTIEPFMGDSQRIRFVESTNLDREKQEDWIQNNNELIKEIGEYYSSGIRSLVAVLIAAGYCILLYVGLLSTDVYILVLLNVGFIMSLIVYAAGSGGGILYRFIVENTEFREEIAAEYGFFKSEFLDEINSVVPDSFLIVYALGILLIIILQTITLAVLIQSLVNLV